MTTCASGFQKPTLSSDLSFPEKLLEGLTLVEELDEVQSGRHQSSHPGEHVGPQHALRLGAHLQTWGPGKEKSGRRPRPRHVYVVQPPSSTPPTPYPRPCPDSALQAPFLSFLTPPLLALPPSCRPLLLSFPRLSSQIPFLDTDSTL